MARGDPNEDAVLCEGQADIVDLDGAPCLGCSAEGNAHGRRSLGCLCRDAAIVAEIAGSGRERVSRDLHHEADLAVVACHKDNCRRKSGVRRCGISEERKVVIGFVHRRRDILRQRAAVREGDRGTTGVQPPRRILARYECGVLGGPPGPIRW